MNNNFDLPSLANLQGSVNQPRNFLKIHDTSFAKNSLSSDFGDLVHNPLCSVLAAIGNVVDNNVCASFGKLKSNAGANSSISLLTSVSWSEELSFLPAFPFFTSHLPG